MLVGYGIIDFFKNTLPFNTNLEHLDFSSNLIEAKCGEEIVNALSNNFSVKSFNISNNTSISQNLRERINKEC